MRFHCLTSGKVQNGEEGRKEERRKEEARKEERNPPVIFLHPETRPVVSDSPDSANGFFSCRDHLHSVFCTTIITTLSTSKYPCLLPG